MTIEISNDYGKIDISNEVIASVVGKESRWKLWYCRYGI